MSTQTEAETIGNKLIRHWTSGTLVTADLSEAGEAVARLEAENAGLREQNTMLDEKLAEIEAQRQPLTDEQLDVADVEAAQVANQNLVGTQAGWRKAYLRALARAIEAAHGIKEI